MEKSINDLLANQNNINDKNLKNLYKKEDYEKLQKDVLDVLKKNKDCSLTELYEKLYEKSGIEDLIKDFFLEKKLAPGAVISYGTKNFEENIVVGNKQEVKLKNNKLVPEKKEMEYDTIFDLASCTKLFTGIATIQLISKNEIKLNDKVNKFLPDFKNIGNLTIYDLLTFYPLETEKRIDKCKDYGEAYDALLNMVPKNISINSRRYNDFSSIVLKYIIEKVTNISFYEYIKINILDILNMNDTFVKVPNPERCANFNYDGRIYNNQALIRTNADLGIASDEKAVILGQNIGNLSGHAGLFSTSADMIKLARGLIDNKVLDKNHLNLMAKNHTGFLYKDSLDNIKSTQYYGLLCYTKNPILKNSEVYHALSSKSFASAGWTGTHLTVDPINKINVCLLSNRCHNRITYIDKNIKNNFIKDHANKITLADNCSMIDASNYSSARDIILHKCTQLALEYKILEDTINLDKNNNIIIYKTKILQK